MPDPLSSPLRVLLVEDNPADARLVQLALQGCRGSYDLWVASDGPAALEYLAARPDVDPLIESDPEVLARLAQQRLELARQVRRRSIELARAPRPIERLY